VAVVAVVLVQQHRWLKVVRQPVRSSPVSANVRSPERFIHTLVLVSALVQVFFFSCCFTHHAPAPRLARSTRALFYPLHRRQAESYVTCAHASPVLYASTVPHRAALINYPHSLFADHTVCCTSTCRWWRQRWRWTSRWFALFSYFFIVRPPCALSRCLFPLASH